MSGELILKNGLRVTGSIIATSFTGSILGTASFYNETDTLQSVVTRGSFASSSTSIILSANDSVQIRGQAGSSNATASLSLGIGTNANNYILAGKALNIQGNRSNTNNLGVTILSAEDSNRAARITVGSGSNASRIQLATTIYQSTGPVTNLEIENQETFIYGPLTIGDDDPNGIYGSLLVTGSSTFTGPLVNNGSTTLGSAISDITSITGSVLITGSSTLSGNLTVTGNTLLGNQLTNTTSTSGSFTIVSNTNSSDRALTIKNATTSQTSGSVDITSTSNTAIPSVFLRTRNNSSNLMIAGTSNDSEIRFTGGELLINSLDGNMTLTAGSYGIILDQLPTSEPSTSGQLWLSGSAGASSKVLCVKI
jgi:hypothetical protein